MNPDPLEVWREALVCFRATNSDTPFAVKCEAAAAIIAQHYAPLVAEVERLRESDAEWVQLTIRDNSRIGKLEGIVRMLANFDGRNSIVHLRDIARQALGEKS